ncbi:hypothetical protein ACFVS2_20410 [Brevibacillus sp. NPDC058079]|uniref:hypothetical protein n=1 Tax=Brevibacillus sp. NPDC058079 TaxID=3346330 RepID=UPI0036E9E088
MEFGYLGKEKEAEFKTEYGLDINYLDSGKSEYIFEGEGRTYQFETLEEVVTFAKTLKGKIKIIDHISGSLVFLFDGVCVWHEDQWRQNSKYNDKLWRGIERNPDDDGEGNTRYSIYDVYSSRELL